MKKYIGILLAAFVIIFMISTDANAQGKGKGNSKGKGKSTTVKKPGPPPWAPAHGYRAKTRYVYFRDYDVYYDNTRGVYISLSGRNWTVTTRLPLALRTVNLVNAVKIDIDLDVNEPQKYHEQHRKKYPKKKKK